MKDCLSRLHEVARKFCQKGQQFTKAYLVNVNLLISAIYAGHAHRRFSFFWLPLHPIESMHVTVGISELIWICERRSR